MRYNWYYFGLDAFGALAVLSTILYWCYGHCYSHPAPELYNIWGNLSSEGIGIWLGVRIIDALLRQHEKQASGRISLVRNTRYLLGRVIHAVEYAGHLELRTLNRELAWSRRILEARKKLLKTDEFEGLKDFQDLVGALSERLPPLVESTEAYYAGKLSREELDRLKRESRTLIDPIEQAQQNVEANLLNETAED